MPKWIIDSVKPLLENKDFFSHLTETEASLVATYVIDRMSGGIYIARQEHEARARERKMFAQIEVEMSAINRLLGDLDSFPRQRVLEIMLELLIVTA